jgi:hypothetical protein
MSQLPRLKRPDDMTTYAHCGDLTVEVPNEYIVHCDNVAHILANTVFMWNARRKLKRYFAITGAELE